jgi:hypothetical protein
MLFLLMVLGWNQARADGVRLLHSVGSAAHQAAGHLSLKTCSDSNEQATGHRLDTLKQKQSDSCCGRRLRTHLSASWHSGDATHLMHTLRRHRLLAGHIQPQHTAGEDTHEHSKPYSHQTYCK